MSPFTNGQGELTIGDGMLEMAERVKALSPEDRAKWDEAANRYVDSIPGLRELVDNPPCS